MAHLMSAGTVCGARPRCRCRGARGLPRLKYCGGGRRRAWRIVLSTNLLTPEGQPQHECQSWCRLSLTPLISPPLLGGMKCQVWKTSSPALVHRPGWGRHCRRNCGTTRQHPVDGRYCVPCGPYPPTPRGCAVGALTAVAEAVPTPFLL